MTETEAVSGAHHDPKLLSAGRRGSWVRCSCEWKSDIYATAIGAYLAFGEHLRQVSASRKMAEANPVAASDAIESGEPSPLTLLLEAADEWEHIAVRRMGGTDDFDSGFRAGVTSCANALRDAIKELSRANVS